MQPNNTKKPSVLVCQRGARHRYAIPRLLNEAGMLAALYTDSCAYSRAGRLAQMLNRCGLQTAAGHALASRVPREVPAQKIFSTDRPLLASLTRAKGFGRAASAYQHWGLQGASVVYSMYGEDFDFLRWAKAQGAAIVIDVFVHPETNRIVADEENRVLGTSKQIFMEDENRHSKAVFDLADILLCPSGWVAEGVTGFMPEAAQKIRINPYGSSVAVREKINEPQKGTILFAGREALRKGLHHLAEAVELLRQDGIEIEARVAGIAADDIGWMKHRNQLTCLGTIPMAEMEKEYAQADAFVLPSLSEGQAGVLLEAMACGLPVIATRESGVDFQEGCGITVPVGDPGALARAMATVVGDRAERTRLAEGALRQAALYSFEEWKKRLVNILGELA